MSLTKCFSGYLKFVFAGLVVLFVALLGANEAKAETGLASWYGPGFAGNPTASGVAYDPYGFTAAHKTLPLGTPITVSYNGRSVDVVVNDRGPYVGTRELDLSRGAAEYLGLDQAGVDYVTYTVGGGYTEAAPAQTVAAEPVATQTAPAATGFENGAVGTPVQLDQGDGQGGGAYTIQSGDTLHGISDDLGTSVEDLAAANGVSNPNVLSVGQTLYY